MSTPLFGDDDSLGEVYRDPNGPAYQRREVRQGPPLGYVGQKIRNGLHATHGLIQDLQAHIPDDLPAPNAAKGNPYSLKRDYLVGPAYDSFYNGLVAFLALYNALDRVNRPNLVRDLAARSTEEFRAWLDQVERDGDVTGGASQTVG
jgi:hypothetical protein